MVAGCRPRRIRSMLDFARDELVFPTGPKAGEAFHPDFQPAHRLLLEQFDSDRWSRFVTTGPSQNGKSLFGYVLPCLYHLFECQEAVILGLPRMEMAADKWRRDLRPVIECSRYADLLPYDGSGSRGGRFESITFRNGATLKFMSGGGRDKKRASYTARVLAITEVDDMDAAGEGSREADKITQMEARTLAFGPARRIYLECTVSIKEGRTWREYQAGSAARIARPCPYCRVWVTPERQHLVGWQDADNVVQAGRMASFACPDCAHPWTEDDRRRANAASKLVHRGEEVTPEGMIVGTPAETDTCGVRWSAVDNHFLTAGFIGAKEWTASRAEQEENAERELCQFIWAIPPAPAAWQSIPITCEGIIGRVAFGPRGQVPQETTLLTAAIDIGKWTLHWLAVAWLPDGRGHVVDYGKQKTEAQMLGPEVAVYAALGELADRLEVGFAWQGQEVRVPDQIWIDSGYLTEVIYQTCFERGPRYRPIKGLGIGQRTRQRYVEPRQVAGAVVLKGERWHLVHLKDRGTYVVEIDSDIWKTFTHERLVIPLGTPGAMTLYKAMPREHLDFGRQLTAEERREEFVDGLGLVTRWEARRSNNHWFDALYMACCAANFCGLTLLPAPQLAAAPRSEPAIAPTASLDGRPYLITER